MGIGEMGLDQNPVDKIFDEIRSERDHQRQRCGNDLDDKKTGADWQQYVNNQFARGFSYFGNKPKRESLVKAASVIVAAIEAHDRNGGFPEGNEPSSIGLPRKVEATVTE